MTSFLTDIKTLRDRARAKMDEGPITDACGADPKQVVDVLSRLEELVRIIQRRGIDFARRPLFLVGRSNVGRARSVATFAPDVGELGRRGLQVLRAAR